MFDYLDKLRAKPAHVRERIAWVTTAVLSLFVASIAWSTWNTEAAVVATATPSTRSPWSVVSDVFTEGKEAMTAAVSDATAQLQHATQGVVEYAPSEGSPQEGFATTEESATIPPRTDVTDVAPTDLPSTSVVGTSIRTRPGSLESAATGTTTGDDMIE